jgi:hypothetical protein
MSNQLHAYRSSHREGKENSGDNDYRLVFSARATMHYPQDEESQLRRTRAHFFGKEGVMKEKDLPEVR